jgi:hypothetical protein
MFPLAVPFVRTYGGAGRRDGGAMRETPTIALERAPTSRRWRGQGPDISLREVRLSALWPLWAAGAYVVYFVVRYYPRMGLAGADSHAYWLTARGPLYAAAPGMHNAYVYSPAFAQAIHPLALLPWYVFSTVWMAAETAAFAWLWAPFGWRWAVPLTAVCSIEIGIGNVYGLLAVALVVGMRHGSVWAFPLLTKITPAVGLIWFAARGEWRRFGWACIVTFAITAVSVLISPNAWHEWIRYLVAHRGSDPTTPYHVAAGGALAVVAARRDKPWLAAPAMLLACPIIHGWLPITLLAAVPRLRAMPTRHSSQLSAGSAS